MPLIFVGMTKEELSDNRSLVIEVCRLTSLQPTNSNQLREFLYTEYRDTPNITVDHHGKPFYQDLSSFETTDEAILAGRGAAHTDAIRTWNQDTLMQYLSSEETPNFYDIGWQRLLAAGNVLGTVNAFIAQHWPRKMDIQAANDNFHRLYAQQYVNDNFENWSGLDFE